MFNIEYRIKRKDGNWIWIHDRARTTYKKDGVMYADGVFTNITECRMVVESLQKSEFLLAESQQITHIGSLELDVVKNELYGTDEVYRVFGLVPQKSTIAYETFLNCVHPEDRRFVDKSVHDTLRNKKPLDIEHRILLRDGTARIIHTKGVAAFDAAGRPVRMVGTVHDITERKRAVEEINLLLTITKSIAEAKDCNAALDIVVRKVCKATGWIYGEAWCPSPDGKYLECRLTWHDSSENLEEFSKKSKEFTFPPGIGIPGRVWSSKKPEWRKDATIDGDFPRAYIVKESGLRAAMGIPVIAKDKVIAVLGFFVRIQRNEDEHLIGLVSSVATQLGVAIERKQAEKALHDNEERLKSILDNTTAVIYIKDVQGRYTFINKQFEKLFHIKRDEIKGKTPYDCFPKEIADSHLENDRKVFETKVPIQFEEAATHNDGVVHSYISIKFPLFDSTGKVYAVCGISTNITERKRMEWLIQRERDRLQKYLDIAAVMFLALDTDGKTTLINNKGCGILGCSEREVVGRNWIDTFVPQRIRDEIKILFDKVMHGEMELSEYFESQILAKNGEERTIAWHSAFLKDEKNTTIGILSSGVDITDYKKLEGEKKKN